MVSGTAIPIPLRSGDCLDPPRYQRIRQRMVLHMCKWDPQVGDVESIGRFPLILPASHWQHLSESAEALARELMAAEVELLQRPDLQRRLGIPRPLCRVLKGPPTPPAARVLRFDFHWTDQGWKISEVNSDVPGGFCEASELPKLMAAECPGVITAGDPGAAWADSISKATDSRKPVALLCAPGFLEDRQVLAYLAKLLRQRQIETVWTQPHDLRWKEGWASVNGQEQLGAIMRFYQAEWLSAHRVPMLFSGGKTPVGNPGSAILTESKRFPLVWSSLKTRLPTWATLLPETRDPSEVPWHRDDCWLLKTAICNTGDTVAIRSLLTPQQWNRVKWDLKWRPGDWIAQRRFNALGVDSPQGTIYPCIGVYTVNGKTAGIYGRYRDRPLIDYAAVDVAVLIEKDDLA
jgi:glutathionylspermidine synthase